jgi:hypothetical protein
VLPAGAKAEDEAPELTLQHSVTNSEEAPADASEEPQETESGEGQDQADA